MVSRTTTAIEEYLLSKLNIPLLVLKLPKNMQNLQRQSIRSMEAATGISF